MLYWRRNEADRDTSHNTSESVPKRRQASFRDLFVIV